MAIEIIEGHKGSLGVERTKDKKSVFIFILPILAEKGGKSIPALPVKRMQ